MLHICHLRPHVLMVVFGVVTLVVFKIVTEVLEENIP
jgi:hypothetical protein